MRKPSSDAQAKCAALLPSFRAEAWPNMPMNIDQVPAWVVPLVTAMSNDDVRKCMGLASPRTELAIQRLRFLQEVARDRGDRGTDIRKQFTLKLV